ncbi:MAG: tetraacyldisaccharide 4'-kinase [Deltaproteobacteria bacterium]|nr:tetraacyldisaccharide 4'-kinase [Deltaproteobacteria bacterium]MBW2110244.1 tetraacyldisaccharide 4'-kinase [Deltaproteobacteria bacterium]MBW2351624.1 tetraacyldisaccharide 4'-kinase [Deltaproteobacteria bacterium]HDZ90308.1 tetraacyldisaccharide 4'-kinase [Deltaproteobacteria bacterium]
MGPEREAERENRVDMTRRAVLRPSGQVAFPLTGWSRIHQRRGLSLWSIPLALFSLCYRAGVWFRVKAYERGILKGNMLPGFVLSVGNITAGGTGKTPAVVTLGRWAVSEGLSVAILSRGYRGRYREDLLEVSDGRQIRTHAGEAGDEPFLLARAVPGSCVIVSKKRYLAGMYAHKKFGSDFFILDDGFQHLGLRRDLNLLLMDGTEPFGNGHLLPWGPLREPLSQLGRADAFILTRCRTDQGLGKGTAKDPVKRTRGFLTGRFPSIPQFCADHIPDSLVFPVSGRIFEPAFLKGKKVMAFAGIARPEEFRHTLVRLGADLLEFREYRDHQPLSVDDMAALMRKKERVGAGYLVTTEKDWMRLAPLVQAHEDLAYLSIRFTFPAGQEGIFDMIKEAMVEREKG